MNSLITLISSNVDSDSEDIQKSFILAGFQRLCLTFGNDLGPYVAKILPLLLNMVVSPIQREDFKQGANSQVTEDVTLCIQLINICIKAYPG